jgi:hypothetical protein
MNAEHLLSVNPLQIAWLCFGMGLFLGIILGIGLTLMMQDIRK